MWLWILAIIVVVLLAAFDLFLRRGRRCVRIVDDPSLPPMIPLGRDPLLGIVRALWNALVLKENGMAGIMRTLRAYDNPLKMLHASVMGIPMLFIWDPEVFKLGLNIRDDTSFRKDPGIISAFKALVGKSLFASEGADAKRQRAVMMPAFRFERLRRIVPKFCVVAGRLVEQWRQLEDGANVESLPWMSKLTLEALGLGGFGYDLHALEGGAAGPYENYTLVLKEFSNPLRVIPGYENLNIESNRKFNKASKELEEFLLGIIDEHNQKPTEAEQEDSDLLRLMSEANEDGLGLSNEELVHNLFLFFLAGHETSSTTMNFVLYHLAKYPEVQEAAVAEVNRVLQGQHATFDTAKELKYLEAIIKETLRFYPPAPALSRKLSADTEIKGYLVPEGMTVIFLSYATHLSDEYFDEPLAFKPERFMNEKLKNPWSYMPFGAGPRICIGQHFAMLEMKIALSMLLQNFRFALAPGHETFMLSRAVTLQTPPGFKIAIYKRR